MKTLKNSIIVLALTMASATSSMAQIGVGVGLAVAGDNVAEAGGALRDLVNRESITMDNVSADFGVYGSLRLRIPVKPIRVIGDVSYVYFRSQQVQLTQTTVENGTSSATFDVGTSMIPVTLGVSYGMDLPVVSPYAGVNIGYTQVFRTYAYRSGSQDMNRATITNASAGDPEFGMGLNVGAEIKAGPVMVDAGARYNFMNLFTTSSDEKGMRYLQLGATLYFAGDQ